MTGISSRISQIHQTSLQGPCFNICSPSNTGSPEGQSQLGHVQNTRAFTPNTGDTRGALAKFWKMLQKGNYPAKHSSPPTPWFHFPGSPLPTATEVQIIRGDPRNKPLTCGGVPRAERRVKSRDSCARRGASPRSACSAPPPAHPALLPPRGRPAACSRSLSVRFPFACLFCFCF